ncbi:hypothetical protein FJZ19_00815 [Candidatus Pacearchaeota archaeon]|nr:hypothetical protein [Candidatus Pacearchaeota archaeon]
MLKQPPIEERVKHAKTVLNRRHGIKVEFARIDNLSEQDFETAIGLVMKDGGYRAIVEAYLAYNETRYNVLMFKVKE